MSRSSLTRQCYNSSPSSSSVSHYTRISHYGGERYINHYNRSHSSSYDNFEKFSRRRSRARSKSSSIVIVSSSSSPTYGHLDADTAESMKLIREIKPDFNVSETSLFAELVKDKNKRELVLKNLAVMEKKKLEIQKPENVEKEDGMPDDSTSVTLSSVMCVTDIIKEIPLPPPIPSSFSSFLSSAPLSKSRSDLSGNKSVDFIDLTESDTIANKNNERILSRDKNSIENEIKSVKPVLHNKNSNCQQNLSQGNFVLHRIYHLNPCSLYFLIFTCV